MRIINQSINQAVEMTKNMAKAVLLETSQLKKSPIATKTILARYSNTCLIVEEARRVRR